MPSTAETLHGDGTDWTAGVRALGARTDNTGTAVTDLAHDEDRLINHVLTEGFLTTDAFVVSDGASGMQVDVGSGTAKADIYVVEGNDDGQHPYLVRLDDATVTITLDAGDADPRIDEIYLVVADATYDGGSVTEAQLVYRKGDAAASPSAPGADAAWDAWVLLASIDVAASASTVAPGDITDNRAASELNAIVMGSIDHGTLSGLADGDHDHGTLSGLSDDDHSQYLNNARHDTTTRHPASVINDGSGSGLDADLLDGVQLAALMGSLEVDGSTEVATASLTTSLANVATVTLSIPSGWDEWKCVAWATMSTNAVADAADDQVTVAVRIDGTNQQEQVSDMPDPSASVTESTLPISVGGRRTGLTTTGNRTVALQAKADGSTSLRDIFLYARAVRTS